MENTSRTGGQRRRCVYIYIEQNCTCETSEPVHNQTKRGESLIIPDSVKQSQTANVQKSPHSESNPHVQQCNTLGGNGALRYNVGTMLCYASMGRIATECSR